MLNIFKYAMTEAYAAHVVLVDTNVCLCACVWRMQRRIFCEYFQCAILVFKVMGFNRAKRPITISAASQADFVLCYALCYIEDTI